jgi:hypothetical protein
VGIDRPDDANVPPDNPADRPPAPPNDGQHPGTSNAETRYREEYYSARTQVTQVTPEQRATTGARQEAPPSDTWPQTATLARWMWGEYHRRWPPEERPPLDRSTDPPGSWRSDSNRYLDSSTNARIEAECDRIVEREQEKISPAMRDTEHQDPTRHLIGFEHRRKGRDRIKEKVHGTIKDFNRSPEQAVSLVPDAIRYTFQYEEACYAQGVRQDIQRIKGQGFALDILKNSWSDDQYKGINSQWIEPDTGQHFEVQFHTRISFEAKQITHDAYKRLRTGQPDEFEQMVLEAFQKKVVSEIPVPPGALDIPDYSRRGVDAR